MASGSIKFALPSNQIEEVKVDLPDPFGPATTVSVGILLDGGRKFTYDLQVRFPGNSGQQPNLHPSSIWEFLNIPSEVIHEHDRMPGGKGILPRVKAGLGRSLSELFRENVGTSHPFQYCADNGREIAAQTDMPWVTLHQLDRDSPPYHGRRSLKARQRDVVFCTEEPVNLRAARLQQRGHSLLRDFRLLHGLGELPGYDFLDRLRLRLLKNAFPFEEVIDAGTHVLLAHRSNSILRVRASAKSSYLNATRRFAEWCYQRGISQLATDAGIKTKIGNHTFRATGITAYLKNKGKHA